MRIESRKAFVLMGLPGRRQMIKEGIIGLVNLNTLILNTLAVNLFPIRTTSGKYIGHPKFNAFSSV